MRQSISMKQNIRQDISQNTRQNPLAGRRGASLVSVLVGTMIVAVSVTAMVTIMIRGANDVRRVEVAANLDPILTRAMNSARSAFSDVGDGRGGICSLMKTRMQTGGVGKIDFEIPRAGVEILPENFEKFFPGNQWRPVKEGCFSSGGFIRCYKPALAEVLGDARLDPETFRLNIQMTPIRLKRAGGGGLPYDLVPPQSSALALNARDAGLMLSIEATYRDVGKDARRASRQHSILWAGEFSCFQAAGTERIRMSPSAIGSGHDEKTLFSSTKEAGQEILSTRFKTVAYLAGEVRDGRARTLTTDDWTATSACYEAKFRCPKSRHQRQWSQGLAVQALVAYNPYNGEISRASLAARPSLFMSRYNSVTGRVNAPTTTFTGVGLDAAGNGVFPPSQVQLNLYSPTGGRDLCPGICREQVSGISYNRAPTPDGKKDLLYAGIEYRLPDGTIINAYDNRPTGCICCHARQCAGVGTRNVGWCVEQPAEPVDARVPECAAEDAAQREDASRLPVTGSAGTCWAARLQNGEVRFTAEDCGASHPYICFSQGRFRSSRNAEGTLLTGSFSDGDRRCRDLGRITVHFGEVRRRLTQQGTLAQARLPSAAGNGLFTYLDSAYVGTFIAPQSSEQIAQLRGLLREGDPPFWVALKTTQDGRVQAPPPLAPPDSSVHVSFLNKDAQLVYAVDQEHPFSGGSPEATLLVHSRGFVGGLRVNSQQFASLRVLCYRPETDSYFLSSRAVTSAGQAASACAQQEAYFYPPQKPLEWVEALLRVAPMDEDLPWPTVRLNPSEQGVWVAIGKTSSGEWSEEAYRIQSAALKINRYGESVSGVSNHVFCATAEGPRIVPGDHCVEGFADFNALSLHRQIELLKSLQEGESLRLRADPPPPDPAPPPLPPGNNSGGGSGSGSGSGSGQGGP